MSHRKTRRVYDAALTYEKLYSAWKTVSQTCKNRQGVFEFSLFSHARISIILDTLRNREYYPNKYRCFMIFEPKPRLVMSQSIRDKIVNHLVAREYLLPLLEKTLIDTNVATRKGSGSSYAMKMAKRYIRQMMSRNPGRKIYALKIDISKYFYTIDHKILFDKLRKRIKDGDVIEILRRIVDETNRPYINKVIDGFNKYFHTDIPHYEKGKGLSIGAMTSQFLAIYYLNDLDHYIKEELKCKYYIRYMDDFVIFGYDKEELKLIYLKITNELAKLALTVNPKSAIYNVCGPGFSFLGYRYYISEGKLQVKCLSSTVRRIKRRLFVLSQHDHDKCLRARAAYKGYFKPADDVPKWFVGG